MLDVGRMRAFEVLGRHLLYDAGTNQAFAIDELCHDLVRAAMAARSQNDIVSLLARTHRRSAIEAALSELDALGDASCHFEQEESPGNRDHEPLGFVILLATADCNLRCMYCFRHRNEASRGGADMDEEVGRKAVDILMRASGPRQRVMLGFSGGEPLLRPDLVARIVEYSKAEAAKFGKSCQFQMTTNGVLLSNDVVRFLNENDFVVDVSIDGPREMHDRARISEDLGGSFDHAMAGALRLLELPIGKRASLQAVLSGANLALFRELPTLFALGFRRIAVTPVALPGESELSVDNAGLEEVRAHYDAFLDAYLSMIQRGGSARLANLVDVLMLLCTGGRKDQMCGAGVARVAVAPNGDIYPCHLLEGAEAFKMGTVFTGVDGQKRRQWVLSRSIAAAPTCRECWARHLCGGGCRAIGHGLEGTLSQPPVPFCEMKKMDIERAIYVLSELDAESMDRLLA